ncbi:hypothetical protein SLE2022_178130 [Rubroshorea leprosula]
MNLCPSTVQNDLPRCRHRRLVVVVGPNDLLRRGAKSDEKLLTSISSAPAYFILEVQCVAQRIVAEIGRTVLPATSLISSSCAVDFSQVYSDCSVLGFNSSRSIVAASVL